MDVDLPAYFARIGYSGPCEPSLTVLRELQLRHLSRIAFECLDPFLGSPVNIDSAAVQAKLVHSRRGGYCQEHNALFHGVLATMGFSVTALGGRVVVTTAGQPGPMTLTHRMTLVDLAEGRFIADVGFGGQCPIIPLRLQHGLEQPTPFGRYRVIQNDQAFDVEMDFSGHWQALYRFTLGALTQADFEVANWYTSTHPRSRFTRNLIVCRVVGETRANLLNATLSVRHADRVEQRSLTSAVDFANVMDEVMGLTLPIQADVIWAKLPKQSDV
jgi:N-hydroxyarylamine O-acetyltransferase